MDIKNPIPQYANFPIRRMLYYYTKYSQSKNLKFKFSFFQQHWLLWEYSRKKEHKMYSAVLRYVDLSP